MRWIAVIDRQPEAWALDVWAPRDERRKRTVQPKTNVSAWTMSEDTNEQATPDFPPSFGARVTEQPLV